MAKLNGTNGGCGDRVHSEITTAAELEEDTDLSIRGNGSCKTGWRAEADYGDAKTKGLQLHMVFYVGTEPKVSHCVWARKSDHHFTRGEMSRRIVFWQAAAQFLNSGETLDDTMSELCCMLRSQQSLDELSAVCPPDGYRLLKTHRVWFVDEIEARERVEHIFVDTQRRKAIRWIEDVDVEELEMQTLLDELYEGEDGS